ncbi:MAG: hypothetical protein JO153_04380 [Solirubrobacterales bacterium]|nr:hypothetical protein [Solirubrobacterales bacterium]
MFDWLHALMGHRRVVVPALVVSGVVLVLAGCGASSHVSSSASASAGAGSAAAGGGASASSASSASSGSAQSDSPRRARPQAIEPVAGDQGVAVQPNAPVGDVNAHAPSLEQIRSELRLELVAVRTTNARYINPLQYVSVWGRTDQGIDATMPVGAPILAPCRVKILGVLPDWYAGQPLVYYELLEGPDAGKMQYVSEQITGIAPVGSVVQQGQPIARYAASGTAIEFGWATLSGVTLAKATTGYTEGQATPAGLAVRAWLNSLGANAGNG